jgi:hypothetical protein
MSPLNAPWRKSTKSGTGNCVEVSLRNGMVLVRDTKANGKGPILTFSQDDWSAFLTGVDAGDFDGRFPTDPGAA